LIKGRRRKKEKRAREGGYCCCPRGTQILPTIPIASSDGTIETCRVSRLFTGRRQPDFDPSVKNFLPVSPTSNYLVSSASTARRPKPLVWRSLRHSRLIWLHPHRCHHVIYTISRLGKLILGAFSLQKSFLCSKTIAEHISL
jgi:hypothetical protein